MSTVLQRLQSRAIPSLFIVDLLKWLESFKFEVQIKLSSSLRRKHIAVLSKNLIFILSSRRESPKRRCSKLIAEWWHLSEMLRQYLCKTKSFNKLTKQTKVSTFLPKTRLYIISLNHRRVIHTSVWLPMTFLITNWMQSLMKTGVDVIYLSTLWFIMMWFINATRTWHIPLRFLSLTFGTNVSILKITKIANAK